MHSFIKHCWAIGIGVKSLYIVAGLACGHLNRWIGRSGTRLGLTCIKMTPLTSSEQVGRSTGSDCRGWCFGTHCYSSLFILSSATYDLFMISGFAVPTSFLHERCLPYAPLLVLTHSQTKSFPVGCGCFSRSRNWWVRGTFVLQSSV